MKIAVIVLHYQNLADTIECLESLKAQDYPNFEVILVDNASNDSDLSLKTKNYPHLYLIRNETNLGFAEGNNTGIDYALERGAEAVLLLNNDTVSSPNLLTAFARAATLYPHGGAFGAKIFFYDNPTVIWHAGGDVHPQSLRCFHYGCGDSDLDKKWEEARAVGYACGCALFIRKEVLVKVGLMEPRFFLLWEEIDWCWRIRKAGYECLYIPEARVWHKISQSFEGGNRGPLWNYYYFRNRLLFLKRNIPWAQRYRFYLSRFLKELGQILFILAHPKTSKDTAKLHRAALKGISHSFLQKK